ncbi:hypothetical protein KBZ20_08835 [Vulcanococcus limneticus Candia 3F8]|uniref:hypothetical protein n=1 Tax=Vulcanococcus limneticus TaxID=2170428 RepID=UPI0012FFC528|nr:hypothetical protein [Vulcanococcus limneticus]MCP9792069.1 hypothetical protein [Vulcanococcus limneticus MW73D5]MCP9893876.1 hypothetical protein [Vulcanococcus limneticus Candia 3F8]MCP9897517.1 hypothetical protein [Vulcanococcus limneticus Candia 3B3]
MNLSARLVALGVSGPIVGLAIFLAISSSMVVDLSQKAKLELTALFEQDNRTNLMLTTSIIQRDARIVATQLQRDSEHLATQLRQRLTLASHGNLLWDGQPLAPDSAPERLNPVLGLPLTIPSETASIYRRTNQGRWQRLAGMDSAGQPLAAGWQPPAATVQELEARLEPTNGGLEARNSLLLRHGVWRMARLTPLLKPDSGRSQQLILAVGVSTDAANRILARSAQLFPNSTHQLAFFEFTPQGRIFCSFAQPSRASCDTLRRAMLSSGGIPRITDSHHDTLSERALRLPRRPGSPARQEQLVLASFPGWNRLAVIQVEESQLSRTLAPLRQATAQMLLLLLAATLLLVAGCATAAWRIAAGIRQELQLLAAAADGIAAGRSRTQLHYGADDALGRLVQAFNRMAGAVADREDSLRERIRTLEIDINVQTLQGQVCSITGNPSFDALTQRAREMRERRRRQLARENQPGIS